MSECGRIDLGNMAPVVEQCGRVESSSADWQKLGHRLTGSGDHDRLTGLDAVDDIATVVAELANRNAGHRRTVSRVSLSEFAAWDPSRTKQIGGLPDSSRVRVAR